MFETSCHLVVSDSNHCMSFVFGFDHHHHHHHQILSFFNLKSDMLDLLLSLSLLRYLSLSPSLSLYIVVTKVFLIVQNVTWKAFLSIDSLHIHQTTLCGHPLVYVPVINFSFHFTFIEIYYLSRNV